ncbi:hypothetical protein CNMCM7691_003172 [Aspergillus felis]|uniref:Ankyrin repeat-containing domain protein n=1 Tax=Aspergillus felis TaxID=1287682 RepID=A0A8H6R2N5_9EURO|nr:hypothetical protein CNMCM7691_003172 [Aspergillus felis]
MGGISKLSEELRLETLGWLDADHDALFSLYNTSTTFRASIVFYLLERNPPLLISGAAETGASKLLERVVARYPEATLNGPSPKLSGMYPSNALVIAARNGHAKVVELILTLETTHKAQAALIKVAKGGHADVVSVMLENFLGHRSSGFNGALSGAIQRGHTQVKKVFREYANPACHYCRKNLNLTARKCKKREKGRISAQHKVAK